MAKRQRRHSQNSQLMRRILLLLRDYDIEEVRLLCAKYESRISRKTRKTARRKTGRKSRTTRKTAKPAGSHESAGTLKESKASQTSNIAKISRNPKTRKHTRKIGGSKTKRISRREK